MNVPIPVVGMLLATATTFFTFGIYFQHEDALKQLRELVQTDPYAFYIRKKIFKVFRFFKSAPSSPTTSTNEDELPNTPKIVGDNTRMQEIMKYGFPGLDDIRLYSDFVLSYDRRNRVAHWVCEHLNPSSVRPQASVYRGRSEYQPDMSVPSNFRSDLMDYNHSGFDRGHLAAAGNHRGHQTHCNETFYLTNIAPQVGKGFNRDAWNNLEIYVRELMDRYKSVYVCTGPLYKPKKQLNGKWTVEFEMIGANMVAVPTHFFKVITIESKLPQGKPYMEAYVMPNAPIPDNINLRSFLCDIREIEHYAGLQFFDGIRRSQIFGTNYERSSQIFREFH